MTTVWNTREVKHFFADLEILFNGPDFEANKANLLAALGMTLEEYNWNIEWIENLVRDYYKGQESKDCEQPRLRSNLFKIPCKDEEIAVVSHNDLHAGNMMMDRNDTTAESLILIDWDLTQYEYRPSFTMLNLLQPMDHRLWFSFHTYRLRVVSNFRHLPNFSKSI